MYRSRWGDSGGIDPGGGGRGGEKEKESGANENDNEWSVAGRGRRGRGGYQPPEDHREREKRNLQMRQLNKMRLELEGCRKNLGKGQIFTAMKEKIDTEPQQMMTKEELAKILVKSNIKKEDVVGIKFNEYRKGQVEFLLADGVSIDVKKMEEAIEDENMKISIGAFDHVEEVMMIYGLPLTKEIGSMKEKIEESVLPFVKHIISIIPCTYSEGGDFFRGKYNGNWRVVVEPKKQTGVPNFIVVGNSAKVQGQVHYVKSFTMRPEMCADCFQEGHLKKDRQCPGIRSWRDYCVEFQRKWEEALEEVCVDLEEEGGAPSVPVSRLEELQKELRDLKKSNRRMEEQLTEVDKGKELGDKKQKEIEELMNKNRESIEERKKIEIEMKKQEESRMELINIMERKEREKQMAVEKVEELKMEMERMRTEMSNKEAEKELLARSLGENHRLKEVLQEINDDFSGMEDDEMINGNAGIGGNVIADGEPEGGRETIIKHAGLLLTGTSNVERTETEEEQDEDEGNVTPLEAISVSGGCNQGELVTGSEDKKEEDEDSNKRPLESPEAVDNSKKTKGEDENADEKKEREMLDKNEPNKIPDKGSEVWVELNGNISNWVVQAKKDSTKGGGCFNCKGLENGERKNINFNTVKWGFLNQVSDISDIEITDGGVAVNIQVGVSEHRTPPPVPPRGPTPPPGWGLPPPPLLPPTNRTVKHY